MGTVIKFTGERVTSEHAYHPQVRIKNVQDCNFNPMFPANTENARFARVFLLRYMGKAEYEWGNQMKSLDFFIKNNTNMALTLVEDITNAVKEPLYVYGLNDKKEIVLPMILAAQEGRIAEESTFHLTHKQMKKYAPKVIETVLWWDFENHFMWSFNAVIMLRLKNLIRQQGIYFKEHPESISQDLITS